MKKLRRLFKEYEKISKKIYGKFAWAYSKPRDTILEIRGDFALYRGIFTKALFIINEGHNKDQAKALKELKALEKKAADERKEMLKRLKGMDDNNRKAHQILMKQLNELAKKDQATPENRSRVYEGWLVKERGVSTEEASSCATTALREGKVPTVQKVEKRLRKMDDEESEDGAKNDKKPSKGKENATVKDLHANGKRDEKHNTSKDWHEKGKKFENNNNAPAKGPNTKEGAKHENTKPKPDSNKPEAKKPDAEKGDAKKPEAKKPDAKNSDEKKPDAKGDKTPVSEHVHKPKDTSDGKKAKTTYHAHDGKTVEIPANQKHTSPPKKEYINTGKPADIPAKKWQATPFTPEKKYNNKTAFKHKPEGESGKSTPPPSANKWQSPPPAKKDNNNAPPKYKPNSGPSNSTDTLVKNGQGFHHNSEKKDNNNNKPSFENKPNSKPSNLAHNPKVPVIVVQDTWKNKNEDSKAKKETSRSPSPSPSFMSSSSTTISVSQQRPRSFSSDNRPKGERERVEKNVRYVRESQRQVRRSRSQEQLQSLNIVTVVKSEEGRELNFRIVDVSR